MTQVRRGERLAGRYEVLSEIGRGGMGAVFEAHDTVLERHVAIKILNADRAGAHPSGGAHLEYEAKLAAKLDHPAIVPVYDFGRDGERLFFVMPIVEGLTLRRMLVDGPLPQVVALVIARQVAEALAHSHARHVVHRDIKPENVMVGPGTDGPRVKVLDFGIAASAADAGEGTPRQILGTLDYLSPEQARGLPLDGRADVYSLGAVLYECCAGKPPFGSEDLFSLLDLIVRVPPLRLGERCPGIEPALEDLVHRCLEKDPGERPESAEKLVELLSRITTQLRPIPAGPSSSRHVLARSSTLPAAPRIVGRESELARVRSRLAFAARGECQLVAVGGSYGVGKSSFVSVVCEASQEWGMSVVRGRALEDDAAPYSAIGDALVGFLRSSASPDQWFEDDADLVPQLVGLFPRLRGILSEQSHSHAGVGAGAGAVARGSASRAEIFELIARAFAAISSHGRPALLVLEDIHSAPSSVEAIRYLFRRLAASSLAIVLTHRLEDEGFDNPLFELRSALLGEPSFADIELRPLERLESDRLAAILLPGARLTGDLLGRLYEATEGNPLHLSELTAALREARLLNVDEGAWRLGEEGRSETAPVPTSMRGVVGKRLQRLPAAERAILEAGVIFGRSFAAEDISALAGEAGSEVLERLVRRGLLTREETGSGLRYLFSTILMVESVRDALSADARRELHRRFAAHLVSARRTTGTDAARLAQHLVLAGERSRAVPYAVLAAKHALEARTPEAVFPLSRIIGRAGKDAIAAEVELDLLLARASARTKAVGRAREIVAEVVRLLEGWRPHRSTALETLEIDALRLAAELAWEERDRETASALRRKARELAAALGRDDEIEAPSSAASGPAPPEHEELVGERLLVQGSYLAAREMLARADARAAAGGVGTDGGAGRGESDGAASMEATVRHALRGVLLAHRLGSYDEAEVLARGARQHVASGPLAGEIDAAIALVHCSRGQFEAAWIVVQSALDKLGATPADLHTRALLLRAKGDASMGLGRLGDATDAYDEGGRLLDPRTFPFEHSAAIFGSGDARIAAGLPDEAVAFFERAERQRLAIGDRWGLSRVHEGHARACLCKGRLLDALSHAERAVVLAVAIADPKLSAITRTRLGLVNLARGELKAARSAFELALRDAQGCGAEPEIAGALEGLAEVQLESGERTQAVETAEESVRRASGLGLSGLQVSALLVIARARTFGGEEPLAEASRIVDRKGNALTKLDVALARATLEADSLGFDALVEQAAAMGARLHVAEALLRHANLWSARGAGDRATPLLLQASSVFAEMGAPARAEEILRQVE